MRIFGGLSYHPPVGWFCVWRVVGGDVEAAAGWGAMILDFRAAEINSAQIYVMQGQEPCLWRRRRGVGCRFARASASLV